MDKNKLQLLSTDFLLITVVVLWAGNLPLVKWALHGNDVFVFNSIRFLVAAVVTAVIYFSRNTWQPLQRNDILKIIGAGIVANVFYQLFFIFGINKTSAGNASILLSTAPLWTVVFSRLIHKEKVQSQLWLGMVISLFGVVLIIFGSSKKISFGSEALFGDILMFFAAMMWALNTNLQKFFLTRYSASQLTFIWMMVGSASLTLIALPSAQTVDFTALHWSYYLAAFSSGAHSIGIATYLWTIGVKRIGPAKTANFNNLVPVLALFLSYVFIGETLETLQFFGAAATIAGVWIARRENKNEVVE